MEYIVHPSPTAHLAHLCLGLEKLNTFKKEISIPSLVLELYNLL